MSVPPYRISSWEGDVQAAFRQNGHKKPIVACKADFYARPIPIVVQLENRQWLHIHLSRHTRRSRMRRGHRRRCVSGRSTTIHESPVRTSTTTTAVHDLSMISPHINKIILPIGFLILAQLILDFNLQVFHKTCRLCRTPMQLERRNTQPEPSRISLSVHRKKIHPLSESEKVDSGAEGGI